MAVNSKRPQRAVSANDFDLGSIEAHRWNDATGADKVIVVEPVVERAVIASENVGAGRLVKVTGTTYTLDLVGRAYDSAKTYQKGDVVTSGADVYLAMQDQITGAFDATKWKKVAPKQVGPVAITAGAVVGTGRWHNTVTEAGFLVDEDSLIPHIRVRD